MTQKKSEDRIVPEDRRKSIPTRKVQTSERGKEVPVNERVEPFQLSFATAENPRVRTHGTNHGKDTDLSVLGTMAEPKAWDKENTALPVTIEEIVRRLREAFQNVAKNKGAPGPDRQNIETVREHLDDILPKLQADLLNGTYFPGEIRRVYIPKPGGQRGLGIPNVVDRMVMEATRLVLEPKFEPNFHPSSHGFRPERSCHTAIAEARAYVEEGYEFTADLDLEKFFDQVCHQRLLARLATQVHDKRVLALIGRMLKAKVVMPDGVVQEVKEGVPQGSPLSPLLSNIVLSELDFELEMRGHKFVRYADDCNIYVQSKRAGERVMESITQFITKRLRLKVNREKSAVARPETRHFLGFRLRKNPKSGEVEIKLSKRSKDRATQRIRELTPRNLGNSLKSCIERINRYLIGWIGFFGICSEAELHWLRELDAHMRRRLRAIVLKHWKRKRTIVLRIIRRGVRRKTAWRRVYDGRKAIWKLSHDPAVERALNNAYFAEQGLKTLVELWEERHENIATPHGIS